jgi:hypothetical protein
VEGNVGIPDASQATRPTRRQDPGLRFPPPLSRRLRAL